MKGFTLVELSIVLVIIGLLIGGILVGQSLIGSSKTIALVRQIQQIEAAAATFKSKYKYLPGDAPAYGGDGDGIIDQNTEAYTYFANSLTQNGLINDVYELSSGNPFLKAMYGNGIEFGHSPGAETGPAVISAITVPNTVKKNYFLVSSMNAGCCGIGADIWYSSWGAFMSFLPSEVAAVDKKIDDGDAGLTNTETYVGTVVAKGLRNGYDPSGYFEGPNQLCTDASDKSKYNIASENKVCSFWVAMTDF